MVATHPTNPSHEYERETTHARSTRRNRNAKLEINTSRTFTSNVFDLSNPIQPGCIRTHRFSNPRYFISTPVYEILSHRIESSNRRTYVFQKLYAIFPFPSIPPTHPLACVLKKNCTKREGRNESFDKTNV